MAGGTGNDLFVFDTLHVLDTSKVVLNDFAAAGVVQDVLDLHAWRVDTDFALEAFNNGQISLSRRNGYTYIQVESGISAQMSIGLTCVYGQSSTTISGFSISPSARAARATAGP
jgi:hypothetical protein